MELDNHDLAALVYDELHEAFKKETKLVMEWRWVSCSDEMQRAWEEAVRRALVRAASLEGDAGQEGHGAASLLLQKAIDNRTQANRRSYAGGDGL